MPCRHGFVDAAWVWTAEMTTPTGDIDFWPDNSRPSNIYTLWATDRRGPKHVYGSKKCKNKALQLLTLSHMPCQSVFRKWYLCFGGVQISGATGAHGPLPVRRKRHPFPRQASRGLDRTSNRTPVWPYARPAPLLVSLANDDTTAWQPALLHTAVFHCPDSWHCDPCLSRS